MSTTINVRQVARTVPGNVKSTGDVQVTIADGGGERARRQAVAAAVSLSDSTSSVTNEIQYMGCSIPTYDFPAGHTF